MTYSLIQVKTLFSSEDKRKTINLTELAKLTGWNAKTLYEWVRHRELPAFRPGKGRGRKWYFHRDDLEIWWRNMHGE